MYMKTFLGIDYGRNHVGLAVSFATLSEPLETVSTKHVFEKIIQYIDEYNVDEIVLGISEAAMAEEIKDFSKKLQTKVKLPIHLQDETLSSYETRVKVAQAGMSKKRREQKIDHLVAAHILQDFLDSL